MCLGTSGIKEAVEKRIWGAVLGCGGGCAWEGVQGMFNAGISGNTWSREQELTAGNRAGRVGSDERALRVSFPMFFCPFSLADCFSTSFSRIRFNN